MRAVSRSFAFASAPLEPMTVFALVALYTQMIRDGEPAANTWLTPRAETLLADVLHGQCFPQLFMTIASSFRTQGEIFQPEFLAAAHACPFDAPCPSFESWSSSLIAEQPGDFSSEAPALLLQGGADTLVTPEATSCIAKRLEKRSTPVQSCLFPYDSHASIVASAFPQALRWMNARRAGLTPDVCPAPLPLTCPP